MVDSISKGTNRQIQHPSRIDKAIKLESQLLQTQRFESIKKTLAILNNSDKTSQRKASVPVPTPAEKRLPDQLEARTAARFRSNRLQKRKSRNNSQTNSGLKQSSRRNSHITTDLAGQANATMAARRIRKMVKENRKVNLN